MAVNYPASLDTFINPSSSSSVANPSHSQQHSDANDAIEALEAKVGITGSAVTTSHDYKIAQLESLVTSSVAGAKSIYQDVRNQSGSSLSKATPVYVSGSEGASGKMLISAASNASESTSSKTMGITTSAIADNSNGQVISEGILEGIDTTGAADGDPVWLGANGTKIYGLVNKPSAPLHLVFLGIVIRGGQANTGSIYVKIQNGFEIEELHNVEIASKVNGNILAYDSTSQTWKNTNTLQSTSSTIPLVIKGAASQTANLQEWQNSSGSVISKVDSTGFFSIGASTSPGGVLGITASLATYRPLVIRGATSQTANLTEWQDSSGSILALINNSGQIATYGRLTVGSSSVSTDARMVLFNTGTTSSVLQIIRGMASQTGDLQQWQRSDGTIDLRITNFGALVSGGGTTIASNPTINAYGAAMVINSGVNMYPMLILKGAASQTADIQKWQNSAGTDLVRVSSAGKLLVASDSEAASSMITTSQLAVSSQVLSVTSTSADYGLTINATGSGSGTSVGLAFSAFATTGYNGVATPGGAIWFTRTGSYSVGYLSLLTRSSTGAVDPLVERMRVGETGTISIAGFTSSSVGLIVKPSASPTANLTEWQDSSGNVISNITSYGGARLYDLGIKGSPAGIGWAYFGNDNTTTKNVVVRGYASQTANLQEWQNSAGSTLAYMDPNGNFIANYIGLGLNGGLVAGGSYFLRINYAAGNTINLGTSEQVTGTQVQITNPTASNIALTVKGATSQIGDLQQWQNSAGTVLAKVDKDGGITTPNINLGTYGGIYAPGSYMTLNTADIRIVTAGVSISNTSIGASAQLHIVNGTAANPGLIVKAATSQTANLQEWQNSSSQVMSRIGSDAIFRGYTADITNLGKIIIQGYSATDKPLVIQGAASQTASLQEWQDSTGAVKASLSPLGAIRVSSSIGYVGGGGSQLVFQNGANPAQFIPTSATTIGLVVKGYASQTANLQEWQNSGGTILTSISSAGILSINSGSNITYADLNVWKLGEASIDIVNTNWKSSSGRNAGQINFRVGGNSGERDNAVSAIRGLDLYSGGSYIGGLSFLTQGGGSASPVERARITNDGYLLINTTSISAQLASVSSSASVPPLVIQHAASQTSSYFEIKNSSGNNVWGINSAGEALTRTTTKYGANIQNDSNNNYNALYIQGDVNGTGIPLYVKLWSGTKDIVKFDNGGTVKLSITSDGSLKGGNSSTVSVNTATTVDTVALSSFTTIEYTISIKQGSKIRSSKILVHTDGTSVDSTEYGIMEMGGGITGILVSASVSSTDSILQITITDAATTNATVKLIKTML